MYLSDRPRLSIKEAIELNDKSENISLTNFIQNVSLKVTILILARLHRFFYKNHMTLS